MPLWQAGKGYANVSAHEGGLRNSTAASTGNAEQVGPCVCVCVRAGQVAPMECPLGASERPPVVPACTCARMVLLSCLCLPAISHTRSCVESIAWVIERLIG